MIKKYFIHRKHLILFYLVLFLLLPLEHFVYSVKIEVVLYLLQMMGVLLLVFLILDGALFFRRYRHLSMIESQNSLSPAELPKTSDSIELKYQEIIGMLYSLSANKLGQLEEYHNEQLDYYNLWVHQIKTPISAIRLLLSSETDPLLALRCEQELFSIEQYVEMALQYLKLEELSLTASGSTLRSGGNDLVLSSCSLREMISLCIRKYSTLFIQKKLSITLEVDEISVLTDEKWFCFLIEQLLSNALKYTKEGGITIRTCQNGGHLSLLIKDTGIGIRADDLPRIFERGYTGYNGRLDKKASGIGLYLVKKAAVLLSLDVQIASELGAYTQARVIFGSQLLQEH